jgi:hypothetical protein
MKHFSCFLVGLSILTGLMLSSCGSQEQQYVKKAVKLMNKHGLFAEGPAWEAARSSALASQPSTMEEAYDVCREALKVAGGKHSFLSTVERQQASAAEDKETAPSVTLLEDGIVLITLPHSAGRTRTTTSATPAPCSMPFRKPKTSKGPSSTCAATPAATCIR